MIEWVEKATQLLGKLRGQSVIERIIIEGSGEERILNIVQSK